MTMAVVSRMSSLASYLPLSGGTLTGHLLFSADNTYDIGASGATRPRTIYLGTSVWAGSGGALGWASRAKFTSPADGIWIGGNNAGTQGVKFDAATTDGTLILTDESGGSLIVDASRFNFSSAGYLTANQLNTGITLFYLQSSSSSGTSATTGLTIRTGAQTNAGDYDSGDIDVYTGATTTDGDTGDLNLYTGAAGDKASHPEDNGDIYLAVGGAPSASTTVLKCSGAVKSAAWGTAAKTLGVGATTFAVEAPVMTITGDGGGNTVATITGGEAGMFLTLIFVDALVAITDTAVGAIAANQVALSGAFTGAAGTVLQLVSNGTYWLEVSRSVNG